MVKAIIGAHVQNSDNIPLKGTCHIGLPMSTVEQRGSTEALNIISTSIKAFFIQIENIFHFYNTIQLQNS